jgi:hypothetical protein
LWSSGITKWCLLGETVFDGSVVHHMFYTISMPWPSTIPHDLAGQLAALDERRTATSDADRWGVIKDWLESHNVPAPDGLPTAPEIKLQD